MPLYMEAVMSLLRRPESFNYEQFRRDASNLLLNNQQRQALALRLSLLDDCLQTGGNGQQDTPTYFKAGQLTIIECVALYC